MKKIILQKIFLILSCSIIFSESQKSNIGLVLSGGGVKGLAHLGTLQIIDSLNIPIDYISGTSIGAIAAALYASGHSAEEIDYITYNSKWNEIFNQNRDRNNLYYFQKMDRDNFQLSFIIKDLKPSPPVALSTGQYSFEYLAELFASYDHLNNFDNMKIPFRCNATNILTGEEVVLKNGTISKALRSSTSIPTVFAPVKYKNQLLVDGGVVNNIPTNLVKDMGADFTIGVNLSNNKSNEIKDVFDMLSKSIGLYGKKNASKNISEIDILISPDLPSVNVINFENSLMNKLRKRGNQSAYSNIDKFINLKNQINTNYIKLASLPDIFNINSVITTDNTINNFFEKFSNTSYTKMTFVKHIQDIRKLNLYYNLSYKFKMRNDDEYDIYFEYEKVPTKIINKIIINGNKYIKSEKIKEMINVSPGDTLNNKDLLANIKKIHGLDYFEHIYYDFENSDNNKTNIIIDVKENATQRFKIGATWDNHYKLIGKAKIDLFFINPKIRIQDELIFSGMRKNTFSFFHTMTKNNELSIIPQIKFINQIKNIGLFDSNFKKYFIRHNLEQKTAGILIPLKQRGSIEFNFNESKSWYYDEDEDAILFPINRLVYTDFILNIDQLDDKLTPKNGYEFNLSYQSSINDGTFNISDLKYSFLDFKFNFYKTFNINHTLRYYTWYTKSIGDVPLYLQTNYGGYDWAIGYSEYDLYAKNLKIYGCEYQYHYKNSTTFRFIISKPTFIDFSLNNSNIEELPITYGFGITIKSIIGPINFVWARGDENLFDGLDKKENLFYFNFGVKY